MAVKTRIHNENEEGLEIDDFDALLIHDLKKNGFEDKDLLTQFEALSKEMDEEREKEKNEKR